MTTEDVHIVEFTETEYGLQHPVSCRPNLLDCVYHQYLAEQDSPEQIPGRYEMTGIGTTPPTPWWPVYIRIGESR